MNKTTQIHIKYFFDRIFSIILSVPLIPFFSLIGIAIKLDDGYSIFFKQKRPGLNANMFEIWKFRTMVPNADCLLDEKGCVKGVNRITRIGNMLRYLSLDELPQLVNIIKGEMSFIGPRPALCEHVRKYTDTQKRRFSMKPGITGLAQISGRNTLKWSERIEYDLRYIENYSLWLDLKILAKTFRVVLKRDGIVLDRKPEIYDDLGENGS